MLRLTRLALRYPVLTIAGTALATLIFASGLLRLTVQTDGAALHPSGDPALQRSEEDRERFSDPELVLLLVRARPGGPSLESRAGLTFLKEVHESLRRMPGVRAGGIRSLASLMDLRVRPDSLDARFFLDEIPGDPAGFAGLVRRIREHPLTRGFLLSPDGDTAALYVPAVASEDRRELLTKLQQFVQSRQDAPFEIRLAGPIVAEALLGDMLLSDLSRLIPIMVGVILLLLWIQLRTPGGLIVPLVEVMVVLVWTLGAMGLAGVPITLVTTLLPVVLMALAITDEIHVLERVQHKLARALEKGSGESVSRPVMETSLLEAMGELERPIVAASLTTALGFFAFPFTSIEPLRHFGLFSTMGFVLSMLASFTTIPALIVLLPARLFLPARERREGAGSNQLLFYERLAVRAPRAGLILGCGLLVLAIPGLFRLRVGDNWISNFDPDSELVAADREFNRELWGTYRFDVVLEGRPDLFHQRTGLALMEEVARRAASAPGVAGALSYLTPVGVIAGQYGEKGPLSSLPEGRAADFLALAAISEDPFGLASYLTPDGSSARLQLFLKSEDYRRDRALEADLRRRLEPVLTAHQVSWHFSGDIPNGLAMVRAIVTNQLRSIGLTFLAIAALLAFTQRPFGKSVLIVMFPVAAATLLVFAGMGYSGTPLGVATSMFASLALGIGVDFGLHFIHGYQQERGRGLDDRAALVFTMAKAGKALRWSSVVLALGFLVLALSSLRPNHSLGLLLAASMAASYVMTLLLLPSLAGRLAKERSAPTGSLADEELAALG
jgi:predicted RND superfamily exporter protein